MATWDASEVFLSIHARSFLSTKNGTFWHHIFPNLNHISSNNAQNETNIKSPELSRVMLTEQRHRKFGRCYTFHPAKWLGELGVYYIKLKL